MEITRTPSAGAGTGDGSTSVPPPPLSLAQPSSQRKRKPRKVFSVVRSVFRTLPIIAPACKFPNLAGSVLPEYHLGGVSSNRVVTGTLFGQRKGKASFLIQENSRTLPRAVMELAIQTNLLQKEMSLGTVRIALECERRTEKDRTELLEEPVWTMYCNGKKSGYSVRREPNEQDLQVMETLRAVSMGAGVLPGRSESEGPDSELAYVRAHYDRVVGSKDSETFYMLSPDRKNGPELSIFFVRT